MTPAQRLQAIIGQLNAYRNGWIAYDRAHVRELQEERAAIERAAKPSPKAQPFASATLSIGPL